MSLKTKEQNLGGMTLNERLYALNRIDDFDQATARKDRVELRKLLKECQLSDEQATATIEQLINPSTTPTYFKKQSRKLLLNYLVLYPFYYVLAMALATIVLWWFLGWDESYAFTWFKIIALIMGGASYLIHWRIGFHALLGSFGK